jgi:hypothetical protein
VPEQLQLENQISEPAYADVVSQLAARLKGLKGLAITVTQAPAGVVGRTYSFPVTVWGGQPPYTWAVAEGTLPPDLKLNPATGLISGTPTATITSQISIRITDTSVSPYNDQPQGYVQQFKIRINPLSRSGLTP